MEKAVLKNFSIFEILRFMYLRTPILKNICERLLLSLFYLKEEQELQS